MDNAICGGLHGDAVPVLQVGKAGTKKSGLLQPTIVICQRKYPSYQKFVVRDICANRDGGFHARNQANHNMVLVLAVSGEVARGQVGRLSLDCR